MSAQRKSRPRLTRWRVAVVGVALLALLFGFSVRYRAGFRSRKEFRLGVSNGAVVFAVPRQDLPGALYPPAEWLENDSFGWSMRSAGGADDDEAMGIPGHLSLPRGLLRRWAFFSAGVMSVYPNRDSNPAVAWGEIHFYATEASHAEELRKWMANQRELSRNVAVYAIRIPILIPLSITCLATLLCWTFVSWRSRCRRLANRCLCCGYCLDGVDAARCPECGSVSASPLHAQRFQHSRRLR